MYQQLGIYTFYMERKTLLLNNLHVSTIIILLSMYIAELLGKMSMDDLNSYTVGQLCPIFSIPNIFPIFQIVVNN